jgi:hypothetical protein
VDASEREQHRIWGNEIGGFDGVHIAITTQDSCAETDMGGGLVNDEWRTMKSFPIRSLVA